MPKISQDYMPELRDLEEEFAVKPVNESYSAEHFGNASLELKGPLVWMRIVRDRGQVFIDMARPDSEWVDVGGSLEALGLHPRPGEVLSLPEYVKALRSGGSKVLGSLPPV
jgi:hypothetical protein